MNKLLSLAAVILVNAVSFIFLAICNWNASIGEWNGFSRFIFALILVTSLFKWLTDSD